MSEREVTYGSTFLHDVQEVHFLHGDYGQTPGLIIKVGRKSLHQSVALFSLPLEAACDAMADFLREHGYTVDGS